MAGLLVIPAASAGAADSDTFTSAGNPILAGGSHYSADPAPLVVPAGAPGNDTDSDQLSLRGSVLNYAAGRVTATVTVRS